MNAVGLLFSGNPERFLVAGTSGAIFAWDWNSIKNSQPELSWTINLPSTKERLHKADVNALVASENEIRQELLAGCGDNLIYAFSLEDGKILRTFEGHTDYLHSLSSSGRQMASASEDGSVRLWDTRQATMTSKIEPHKEFKLARNHFGKWVGDVSITDDWLLCGGGPRCSLWNMRTMDLMTSFSDLPDFEIHIARIRGDSVLTGGATSQFFQSTFTGKLVSKMSTSAITLYSALYSNSPREVITLAGCSNNIDICTNFTYRHKVLQFY
ncbi:hypothetical protein GE061_018571 [Apolygus lucorum]|uniref:THO complex subunit 6 n=1 Tax=Apolygus lucorum TaxID=248454 RepID=A0A8S9XE49_APOLU|nr:hypothetical protein GE061_018571 [Apolygus lucorum]